MASVGKKLTVSALSLLGMLGAVEVALRVVGYDPFGEMMRSGRDEPGRLLAKDFLRTVDHDVLVYDVAPNASAHAFDADITTNSHGFRDREYPTEKPAGATRIVALGDSATFGVKLPADVLWPERLEVACAVLDRAVEVLNLGIVGYDTLEEVAFFEDRGRAFDPDVVVVGFHVNDLGYASPTREYIARVESYGAPLYRLRLAQLLRSKVDSLEVAREQTRRATEEFFEEENADVIEALPPDDPVRPLLDAFRAHLDGEPELAKGSHRYVRWFGSEARVGKLRFAFERLAVLAGEDGFRVVVMPIPWLGDAGVESAYDAAYAIAEHEAQRAGFDFVDTVTATRAAGHPDLRIVANDYGHPNAAGHALLAERLLEFLRERGLL